MCGTECVVFIVTSLSNLVLERVEVPGTSMNNCTDQEKISAKNAIKANVQQFMANGKLLLDSTVRSVVASTSSITLAYTIHNPPQRTRTAHSLPGVFPRSVACQVLR